MTTLYADLRRAAQRGLVDAVNAAEESARESPLFNDGPNAVLRKSIAKSIGDLEGEVSAGAKHVRFVECGTEPHEIVARRKMLRFMVNGKYVFARRVMHPGTRARPFMGTAADVGQQVLDYGVDFYVGDAIDAFNASGE